MALTYNPSVFHVNDIPQAMSIIMTPEGSTTADRWEKETPYMADLIAEQFAVTEDSLLLDYGFDTLDLKEAKALFDELAA